MMKSRLSASVSTLLADKQRNFFSRAISISSSNMSLFNGKCRSFSSFQHQHFEALRRAVHKFSSEDEFSELGPPVAGSAATQLKLVTEKPEPFVKTDPAGEASVSSFQHQHSEALRRAVHNLSSSVHNLSSEDDFLELGPPVAGSAATRLKLVTEKPEPFVKTNPADRSSVSRRSLKDTFLGLDKTSQASNPKLHNHHDLNWKNSLKMDSSSCSKSNENVHDGLYCCKVGSQNSESSGRDLPNHPLHAVEKAIIRIQGIGKETTDPMIHSICKSIGALEGFAREEKDSVDALFRVTNGTDAQSIVQRLNNTVVDDCHWLAYQIPRDSSTTLSVSEEVGSKLALRINGNLMELRKQFEYKKIYFEDLQILHMGIMHLEGLPTISNTFRED